MTDTGEGTIAKQKRPHDCAYDVFTKSKNQHTNASGNAIAHKLFLVQIKLRTDVTHVHKTTWIQAKHNGIN